MLCIRCQRIAEAELPDLGYKTFGKRLVRRALDEDAGSTQADLALVRKGGTNRRFEGGVERLVWADGELVAMLETDALPFEELLLIAESSSLLPAP